MQNLIYIIIAASILILLLIIVISILISKSDQKKVNKLVEEIVNESPFRKSDPKALRPHNEPLARNKLAEKLKQEEMESAVSIYNPKGLDKQFEDVKIVGLAEPKGFWSRFIMGQKMSYIMARLQFQNNAPNNGFWTNLIKAQSASQGKDQGRGR
ncbi:hypothetical protein I862_03190 [endosymbiont of Acanthamoeba sp. UWC8]|uniref:hypothetical protein n=1 Tax=endosymbiont of Acanthamoeba sp. UWC8 TaxID=86106 RepID=UPI0004D1D6A5|nr:hypothetical protein [endosymbiont of Acanthamoeba sp. UWC8]AIF81199.1 hypothetical protein I862_03190 [endosymbiont of Acanthamoeba sp. UWC8]